MIEEWKPINEYPTYVVSNTGKVKNTTTGTILKQYINKKGYCGIGIRVNGKSMYIKVHRAVAKAFISNPDNKPTVNHIDGNKSNNLVHNLEWATYSENMQHAFDNGLKRMPIGEGSTSSKLNNAQREEIFKTYIRGDKNFGSVALGKKYGVAKTQITRAYNNYHKLVA